MLVGDLLDYSLGECPSWTPIHFSAGSGICLSGEVAGVSFPTCSMTYGTNRHHASKFSCQSLDPENPSLKCVVCGGSASWRRKMGANSKLTLPVRRVQGGCWRMLLPSNFCLVSALLHLPQVQIPDSNGGFHRVKGNDVMEAAFPHSVPLGQAYSGPSVCNMRYNMAQVTIMRVELATYTKQEDFGFLKGKISSDLRLRSMLFFYNYFINNISLGIYKNKTELCRKGNTFIPLSCRPAHNLHATFATPKFS